LLLLTPAQVEVKELEDIQNVVETAETWLQRVREALEEASDEGSLEALETLLGEADDIPVIMVREEKSVVRIQHEGSQDC
jgi:hypothetical protein